MKVYLAINNTLDIEDLVGGADILSSYYYCKKMDSIISKIPMMRNFILDSGVFTFINSGKQVDIKKYTEEYAAFVREHRIKNYVEMDVDQIYGVEETRRLRDKLENLVGWQSIPVWHTIRGKESFIKDCKDYDYIALGYFLTEGLSSALTDKYARQFVLKAHSLGCRIHGLGFTKSQKLKEIPFDSVDSSTWSCSRRYGYTFKFFPKEGLMKMYQKPEGKRMKKAQALGRPAFIEWRKYQDYMYNNVVPIWK